MIIRAHRSNYIKQYFMIIGVLCVFVVCVLFFLLDFGMVKNFPVVGNNLLSTKSEPDILPTNGKSQISFVMIRERRAVDSKIREKKRILERIDEIRESYDRCIADPKKNCEKYREEMHKFGVLLDIKSKKMGIIGSESDVDDGSENYLFYDDNPDENNEYPGRVKKIKHFHPMPKVHEDLDRIQHEPWKIEKEKSMFESTQHRPENLMPFAAQPDPTQAEKFREKTDDKVITPLKSPGFGNNFSFIHFTWQIFAIAFFVLIILEFNDFCVALVWCWQIRVIKYFKYATKLADRVAIRNRLHQIIVPAQHQVASSQTTSNHIHSFRIISNSNSSNNSSHQSAVCLLKILARKKYKNQTQRFYQIFANFLFHA